MLLNKKGLWTSDDEWNFKTKDGLIYIENISETKYLGTVLTSIVGHFTVKVILGDFIKDETRYTFHQLWKKGEPNTEGYFTLGNFNESKLMTAFSTSVLQIKGNKPHKWIVS